jgi:membrane-bound metal-dependent hydrolase YbcI (DUF457 family)
MFIAHLPAGYLTARTYQVLARSQTPRGLLLAGLAGGLFPDLDLVYAILADGGRQHHHLYWPHLPAVWLALTPLAWLTSPARFRHAVSVFLLAVWSHLLLDSVAGDMVFHPRGWFHYYAHLDTLRTRRWSWVVQGEPLGEVGNTGNAAATPPHLHYAILSLAPRPWDIRWAPQGWKRMFYRNPSLYLG